jgi:Protein of unknown function (DUF4230)
MTWQRDKMPAGLTMKRGLTAGMWMVMGFVAGLIVAAAAVLLVRQIEPFAGRLRIDTSRPSIVRQIRELQRLETVVFTMDKIVSGGYENRVLPRLLAGDRLLLIVYGDVTAGVDLGRVDASAVNIDGASVRLALPPSEVFSTRIDNDRTRVYSRETGLFSSVDPNLESEVRREAERQVRQAALDGGILRSATANAATTLKSFLQGLGFERVEVGPAPSQ